MRKLLLDRGRASVAGSGRDSILIFEAPIEGVKCERPSEIQLGIRREEKETGDQHSEEMKSTRNRKAVPGLPWFRCSMVAATDIVRCGFEAQN